MESPESPTEWITLAVLKRPQGRKGEILADLLTDFPERFREHPEVFLAPAGFSGAASAARPVTIADFWLPVGRNQGRVVLAFSGIDSIDKAEKLEQLEVVIPASERLPLDEGVQYISDLVGCEVFDLGGGQRRFLGRVAGMDFPTTADGTRRLEEAAPLLLVQDPDGNEILIPYVEEFLREVSTTKKTIEMCLPSGLIELNQIPRGRAEKLPGSSAKEV